ncbi:hypothetical protein HDF24_19835 [Mucilaginibacter sp. X4EP1]|uniref:hypothetical protein n=1 Tax=Mucilaginibacter sp. X4EP1 TaxID=2723092 RepID=UPI002166F377|nr:hypothetical protein [Mucilaginibacter sp. X4EP1]MCS3812781.1 hypothetical protein [Mucilaginibacter sp. X4EP1]
MVHKYEFTIAFAANAVDYHKEGSSITLNNEKQKDTFNAKYYFVTNEVRYIRNGIHGI